MAQTKQLLNTTLCTLTNCFGALYVFASMDGSINLNSLNETLTYCLLHTIQHNNKQRQRKIINATSTAMMIIQTSSSNVLSVTSLVVGYGCVCAHHDTQIK